MANQPAFRPGQPSGGLCQPLLRDGPLRRACEREEARTGSPSNETPGGLPCPRSSCYSGCPAVIFFEKGPWLLWLEADQETPTREAGLMRRDGSSPVALWPLWRWGVETPVPGQSAA